MLRKFCLLISGLAAVVCMPHGALASGPCLYPTAGYLVVMGGSAGDLESAPSFGARLEYNFSSGETVRALGLVYSFSRHDMENRPDSLYVDQHLAMIGYRLGREWRWLSFGSHFAMGAAVRDAQGGADPGFSVGYAVQAGINMSVCPFPWLQIGPDISFLTTTNIDESSYFFFGGGHVGVSF